MAAQGATYKLAALVGVGIELVRYLLVLERDTRVRLVLEGRKHQALPQVGQILPPFHLLLPGAGAVVLRPMLLLLAARAVVVGHTQTSLGLRERLGKAIAVEMDLIPVMRDLVVAVAAALEAWGLIV